MISTVVRSGPQARYPRIGRVVRWIANGLTIVVVGMGILVVIGVLAGVK
jgi:hypothetical protein